MDAWDCAAIAGVLLLIGGIGAVYWPLALIVSGCGILSLYYLRERRQHVP